jgi:hypothetical protein
MYGPHLYMFKFLVWSIYVLSAGAFASSLRYSVAWGGLLHDIDNAFHGYSLPSTLRLISYIFCRLPIACLQYCRPMYFFIVDMLVDAE